LGDEGTIVADLALALIDAPSAQPLLTLVAEADGEIIGNVLFSTAHIHGAEELSADILAPLAVTKNTSERVLANG